MTQSTTGEELKACPNPWCTARSAPLPCALKREGWRVRCECGVSTYRAPTEAEARAMWNTRPTPKDAPQQGEVRALPAWAGAASNEHNRDAYSSSELRSGIKHLADVVERFAATPPPSGDAIHDALTEAFSEGADWQRRGNCPYMEARNDSADKLMAALYSPVPATPVQTGDSHQYRLMLLDLLAVIHRDGGHKTQEIGIKLAHEQAMRLSSERIAALPVQKGDVEEREKIERAIKATEYKYFGDYEMSDNQWEAVDQLVLTAQRYLAGAPTPHDNNDWRKLRVSPFIIFDPVDETYFAGEKWAEELWEADQFMLFDDASAVAVQHGGIVESYIVHDHPGVVRSVFAALSTPVQGEGE